MSIKIERNLGFLIKGNLKLEGIFVRLRSSRRRSLRICQDELTMSQKKADRIAVISQMGKNKPTVEEGSELLGINQRQIYRMMKRVKQERVKGVIHKYWREQSNTGCSKELKAEISWATPTFYCPNVLP